jgi:hypothetical protein
MAKLYTFTMDVEVDDEETLFDNALFVATQAIDGPAFTQEAALDLLRPNGLIDVGACVQMVLDPGESPPGLSLVESSIAESDESIFNVDFGDERN